MTERFAPGAGAWRARLGKLRDVVRQELVTRQLTEAVPDGGPLRVLDAGCGQGTQLLRLARRGHQATGLDTSDDLLAELAAGVAPGDHVRVVRGRAEDAATLFGANAFDVVLCHGVLMYLDDPRPVLRAIRTVAAPGATVSLLVRNADALAMRPAQLGDWAAAARAFDDPAYGNRIGVTARADHLADLSAHLADLDMPVREWFGVRVFTDLAADDAPPPDGDALDLLLACEERAARTDPYRRVAPLLHVIADRR
ncbi:MAG TPA: methyltransferase domain-containing protein [Streptosporangiaceae bacterium]